MVEKYKPTVLSRERINELQQHRRNLTDALAEIEKLEECGEDCQQMRADLQGQSERIDTLLANFGGKPAFKVE
jgi:hypothetical protein